MDSIFNYQPTSTPWDKLISKQMIYGMEYRTLSPMRSMQEDLPQEICFELPTEGILLPGMGTRFHVETIFEKKAEGEAEWKPVEVAEAANVMLSANWFEKMIADVEVAGQNLDARVNFEMENYGGHLNTFHLAHMDPFLKKFLCYEDAHPGNGIALNSEDWDFEGKEWKRYASEVFKGRSFTFSWIPLNVWPFFQRGIDMNSRAVPLYLFDRLQVRLKMNEKSDSIFIKKTPDTNLASYRVRLTDVKLVLEMIRLNPNLQGRIPLPKKKASLSFQGPVRKMESERIPSGSLCYKKHFNRVKMPAGLLMFAISQNTTIGDAGKIGFLHHNIKNVQVSFNDALLYNSDVSPQTQNFNVAGPKEAFGRLTMPIGGIPVDWKLLSDGKLSGKDSKYAFPHVYVPLCYKLDQRLLPNSGFSPSMVQPGTLSVYTCFKEDADWPADFSLVYYIFYDDESLVFDAWSGKLACPYF